METILFTPYDCLVRADGKEHFIEKNQKLEFSNLPSSLAVYPTSQKRIIPFMVAKDEKSPFYKIVKNKQQLFIFLIDGLFVRSSEIYRFPQYECSVEISSHQIAFITRNSRKEVDLPSPSKDVQCGNFGHIIYLLLNQPNEKILLCFNAKNNLFKLFYAQELSITKNGFSLRQANGVRKELFVDKEGLKIKEGGSILYFTSPLNIPLCFMECLKEKEYSRALSFLSPSLASQTEEELFSFFGEIDYIFPINTQEIFAIAGGEGKVYSFATEGGKIQEISDN